MTVKRKIKSSSKKNEENYFIISSEKKKKLIGIFLIVFAVLLLLSIISYSPYDQANLKFSFSDLFNVFSPNAEFAKRAESAHNWLGIFGAYISYYLINNTVGYFSIIFPIVLFIWGYEILGPKNYKIAVYLSNFLIVMGILFSAFFGILRSAPEISLLSNQHELAGNIGDFFGKSLSMLLGGLGSIIVIITLFFVSLIIAFDIKIENVFKFLKIKFTDAFEGDEDKSDKESKGKDNLSKIRKLRAPKKSKLFKKKISSVTNENEDETRIRIIRKDIEEKTASALDKNKGHVIAPKQFSKKEISLTTDEERKQKDLPDQWDEKINYVPPNIELLDQSEEEEFIIPEIELKHNAELLKRKLALFDIKIEDISVTPGPVVTLYEIVPSAGVKISRIVSLEHDIALALAARGIRIIAPIPGKSAIGVEIPNAKASLVTARAVFQKLKETKAELPMALGKTIAGDSYVTDLALMPHLLIAGSTGSGKSVGLNIMITSLLFAKKPSEIKFVIIDPKKIELSFYKKLNKHFLAVSPDIDEEIITNPQNALVVLKAVEYEMEKRYNKLAKVGVRNIIDYNKKVTNPRSKPQDMETMKHYKLPYIIVIIDELADLMLTSGKEVEEPIARLAQLARAVGIHLIVATQRPSVNVLTGVIKANFSARISYQVATKIDSRTILDMNGAEQLLGNGDMLFLPGNLPKPIRIQNAFISTEEVEKITNYIYIQKGFTKRYLLPSMFEKKINTSNNFLSDLDPMFQEAAKVIVNYQQGSVSLLQRKLKLGYARAARIVDQLEQARIVGTSMGSKAREVLVENQEDLETLLRSLQND